jgi:hypothetical protein
MALKGEEFVQYYLYCLENRLYSFYLQDGSFFQFDTSVAAKPFTLRYCFVPAAFKPVEETEEEVGDTGPLLQVPQQSGIPLLRYEYVESEYRPFAHPTAHLHVGFPKSGRMLVDRVLSPLDFFNFVARWLHGDRWYATNDGTNDYAGYVLEREHAKSLLACRQIPAEYIDQRERTLLHLGVVRTA